MPERGKRLDESESITVTVTLNGKRIYARTASITSEIGNSGNYRYTTDNGEVVIYKRNQGYNGLAKELLDA